MPFYLLYLLLSQLTIDRRARSASSEADPETLDALASLAPLLWALYCTPLALISDTQLSVSSALYLEQYLAVRIQSSFIHIHCFSSESNPASHTYALFAAP